MATDERRTEIFSLLDDHIEEDPTASFSQLVLGVAEVFEVGRDDAFDYVVEWRAQRRKEGR